MTLGFPLARSLLAVALVMAIPASAAAGPGPATVDRSGPSDARGYIVMLKTGRSPLAGAVFRSDARVVPRTVRQLEADLGFRSTHRYRHALSGFSALLTRQQLADLADHPAVSAIALDEPVELAQSEQVIPTGVRRVRAHTAPATAIDGIDLPGDRIDADVAIIDTGIRRLPPGQEQELLVAGGHNCASDGSADEWGDVDVQGHGTHVAGTVGAIDNGIGVVGVAPGVRLWSVRVFDAQRRASISSVVCAIDWVTGLREVPGDPDSAPIIEVVNMSLSGPGGGSPCSLDPGSPSGDPQHDAICRSVAAGITYVVAAGNQGTSASFYRPATYDEVITVAALTDTDGAAGGAGPLACPGSPGSRRDDTFADYSNHGPDVDVIAPGSCILSLARDPAAAGPGGAPPGTALMTGTSMAAPHVAGAAALHRAANPGDSPAKVRHALRGAATLDWLSDTDPDGDADRLLDVARMAGPAGLSVWAAPALVVMGSDVSVTSATVHVTREGGFSGQVTLSVSGLPAGVTAAFQEPTLAGMAGIRTDLVVTVAPEAASGEFELELRATASGTGTGLPLPAAAPLRLLIDREPPVVTELAVGFATGEALADDAVPLLVTWAAVDPGQANGIARYMLHRSSQGAAWQNIPLGDPLATSVVRQARLGEGHELRVIATDRAGNTGTTELGPLRPRLRQSSDAGVSFSGSWRVVSDGSASGGSLHRSKSPGSTVRMTFSGRSVGWVASVGPKAGKARVWVDGLDQGLVDLRRSGPGSRQVVFAFAWAMEGRHSIEIVIRGGVKARPVTVDAFLMLAGQP